MEQHSIDAVLILTPSQGTAKSIAEERNFPYIILSPNGRVPALKTGCVSYTTNEKFLQELQQSGVLPTDPLRR